jgi:nucleoside-diphosphate kinase
MTMEQTLVIAKPDAVGKSVVGKIIDRFESSGLSLRGLKMVRLTGETADQFYAEHRGKPFFDPLLVFMTSGPVVPMIWEGEGAIAQVRSIVGATNSSEAAPGTLRKIWGTDNRRNLVHASDSPASAAREIAFFFDPSEKAGV